MQIIRYQTRSEGPRYGWIFEGKVGPLQGTPFGDYRRLEATLPLEAVQLLAPVEPSKIICIGRNYAEHARELNNELPDLPILFLKPPSAILDPGGMIILPPQSQQVDYETELVVVIGRTGRWIQPEMVNQHIFGYTVGLDITARDLQTRDQQWTRAKGFDTFCPLGPWIETEFESADAVLACHVNKGLRQMASTRDMIFNVPQLVAFISTVMTLQPGDIIMTGTPAGVGPLAAGDTIEAAVEGIGILRCTVAAA